jgi:AraC-like DNA-binding protein
MLRNSDFTNIHIALETGFKSAERFHSTFKSMIGLTPGQYRNAQKNTIIPD